MSQKLIDFLTALPTDENLRQAFGKDTKKTMQNHGLSSDEIQLIVNKNYNEIARRLGENYAFSGNTIHSIIQVFKVSE